MKRLFKLSIIISIVLLTFACKNFIKPVENPICSTVQDSWICEQSEKQNIQPETVYGWIYNAGAIAVIADAVTIKEICDFEQKIADWYDDVYPVSYSKVISKVVKEAGLIENPENALLINNIINRNILLYNNEGLIKPDDDMILRKGHYQFKQDMLCK